MAEASGKFVEWRKASLAAGLVLLLSGCATTPSGPPKKIHDACAIFEDRGVWYEASKKSAEKWGVPISVQLAILHQESSFRGDAQPPRATLFWFIPWTRLSSAYGYPQAKDETWSWYQEQTGNRFARRDDYADAVDFVGWYCDVSHKKLGLAKNDAYSLYLTYHEGHRGYKDGTYRSKAWLTKVARKVEGLSRRYQEQLTQCRGKLESPPGLHLF
ncbi:MAG: hypothetical protein HQL51_12155 [Magnetococcales bacterium]|nr:hypothetical protein [Magnetococcales bacterium]